MVARLPVELTDEIIDGARHDLGTLEKCSLVARAWRPRSLDHLFHAVEVRDNHITQHEAFLDTRQHLVTWIQMPLPRFAQFVSRRSGRRMFARVRQLVLLLGQPEPSFDMLWSTLRFPKRGRVCIKALRIALVEDYDDEACVLDLLSRVVRLCRDQIESLSVSGAFNAAPTALQLLPLCPRLTDLRITGGCADEDELQPWPQMGQHQPMRVTVDSINAAHVLPWAMQNAAFINSVHLEDMPDQDTCANLLRACPSLIQQLSLSLYPDSYSDVNDGISSLIAGLPALAVLQLSVGSPPYNGKSDSVYELACFLALVRCSTLHTLVLHERDAVQMWEMPTSDDDADDNLGEYEAEDGLQLPRAIRRLEDYRWGALDTALAATKWKGVRCLVLSVIATRVAYAEDVQRHFQAYASRGLPTFCARAALHVVCTAKFSHLEREQRIAACVGRDA